jgi:subtilase family serine protease
MHEADTATSAASCGRALGHHGPLRAGAGVLACLTALTGAAVLAGSATASVASTGSVRGPEQFVRVGSAPRLSPAAVLLGRVPASQPIEIDVALRPRDPAALARFASAVSDPASPEFRRYLRPGTFGAVFGATAATVRATTTTLRKLGLHVGPVSSNHLLIKVSATVADAERAFDTTLMRYRLVSGAQVYANLSAPRVPAAVAGGIQAIAGLSDLALEHPGVLVRLDRHAGARRHSSPHVSAVTTGGPQPCQQAASAASYDGGYTADQIASAYGFSGLYAAGDLGAGKTVAIFELEGFDVSDIESYDECYFGTTQGAAMASPPRLNVIDVDGGPSGAGSGGSTAGSEATVDVEDVSGLVPLATIDVYEGPDNDTSPLDVYNEIVTESRAEVISTSWGGCEAQDGGTAFASAEANLFEEAAAQGQTVVAASGDDGSSDCTNSGNDPIAVPAVDDPASQSYVTGVGGTTLDALGSPATASTPGTAPTEIVWNDGGTAGGGGISSNWVMPAYQSDAAAALQVTKAYSSPKPCDAPTGYCREVPDVSADADPATGMVIYSGGAGRGWISFGGTSIAAPLWAALAVLADAWPACGGHSVGFLNPSLYSIAGASPSEYASAFNDITRGNNHLSQFSNWWRYGATIGYDMASGLGTPIAANAAGGGLVALLCALPESGGARYASPTKSSITALRPSVEAKATAFSWITVTLRTSFGVPLAAKRVILVGTSTARGPVKTVITPASVNTNAKGVAVFKVSDTLVQNVIYRATDLTDGVLVDASVTVSYLKP